MNPSQLLFRPVYEIKKSRTFKESVIPYFTQFSCVLAKKLVLKWRLATKLCVRGILKFP